MSTIRRNMIFILLRNFKTILNSFLKISNFHHFQRQKNLVYLAKNTYPAYMKAFLTENQNF